MKYPKCTKGNFHEGELLNYVLLNATTKDEVLGCAVCQEEKKIFAATWRPLKVVLHQALESATKHTDQDFNSDEILQFLDQ